MENFHVSEAFNLTKNKNLDIFSKMKYDKFKIFRKRTIDCVLATDMSVHFKQVAQISAKLTFYQQFNSENGVIHFDKVFENQNKFETQQEFMNFLVHLADVAHPAKPWYIEQKWSDLIFEEFFNQGDLEKSMNLPVSFLCDRETTDIPKSQVGFIKNIITPCILLMNKLLPGMEEYRELVDNSLEKWTDMTNSSSSKSLTEIIENNEK